MEPAGAERQSRSAKGERLAKSSIKSLAESLSLGVVCHEIIGDVSTLLDVTRAGG
jgi:hypothetical protein